MPSTRVLDPGSPGPRPETGQGKPTQARSGQEWGIARLSSCCARLRRGLGQGHGGASEGTPCGGMCVRTDTARSSSLLFIVVVDRLWGARCGIAQRGHACMPAQVVVGLVSEPPVRAGCGLVLVNAEVCDRSLRLGGAKLAPGRGDVGARAVCVGAGGHARAQNRSRTAHVRGWLLRTFVVCSETTAPDPPMKMLFTTCP